VDRDGFESIDAYFGGGASQKARRPQRGRVVAAITEESDESDAGDVVAMFKRPRNTQRRPTSDSEQSGDEENDGPDPPPRRLAKRVKFGLRKTRPKQPPSVGGSGGPGTNDTPRASRPVAGDKPLDQRSSPPQHDYDDHHYDDADFGGFQDDEPDDHHSEPPPPPARVRATRKKTPAQKAPAAVPKKKKTPRSERVVVESDDEEEVEPVEGSGETFVSPGGTRMMKVRKSLHPSEVEIQEAHELGLRRSGRRRWTPLSFWKGERVPLRVPKEGALPEATQAVRMGILTPETVRVPRKRQTKRPAKRSARSDDDESDAESDSKKRPAKRVKPSVEERASRPLKRSEIPEGVEVWEKDELVRTVEAREGEPMFEIDCLKRSKHMTFAELKMESKEASHETLKLRAEAAAAFDTPEVISGILRLPPLSQKDEESTGPCSQYFTVVACQPKSLYITVGDKGVLVSPGDHLLVPHGTPYSVSNFSKLAEARIAFVVIKPDLHDGDV
jgi:mannose-6-phosphate isomerase-like protein (cupin superfamily)